MTLEQAEEQYPSLLHALEELLGKDMALPALDTAVRHLDWDRDPNIDMTGART